MRVTTTCVAAGLSCPVGRSSTDTTFVRRPQNTAKKGRITASDVKTRMSLLTGSMDYAALSDCDLIIEAIFENMQVKKQVFAKLASVAKPGCILASNTSALDIDDIATAVPPERRKDVIGHHYFSEPSHLSFYLRNQLTTFGLGPANVMKLLEIVVARESSKEVIGASMAVSRKIGKVAALAGNAYGFIGNRILYQRQREATRLVVEEGVMPWDVDRVLLGFGFPSGFL